MKKKVFIINITVLASIALLNSCNTPTQKVENAQENVAEANKDLLDADKAYIKEIEEYRATTNDKIISNDKAISEFKDRIENQKKEAKAEYKQKVSELELKNSDLRMKLDSYKADNKENWENFKTEFAHDMDALEKAFKDIGTNNVK